MAIVGVRRCPTRSSPQTKQAELTQPRKKFGQVRHFSPQRGVHGTGGSDKIAAATSLRSLLS